MKKPSLQLAHSVEFEHIWQPWEHLSQMRVEALWKVPSMHILPHVSSGHKYSSGRHKSAHTPDEELRKYLSGHLQMTDVFRGDKTKPPDLHFVHMVEEEHSRQ